MKKNNKIYTTVIIFTIILSCCLIGASFFFEKRMSLNEQISDYTATVNDNPDTEYLGYNVNFDGAHYFLVDTNKDVSTESYITTIISRRNNDPYNISVEQTKLGYIDIRNISQGELNGYTKIVYYNDRVIEGTCTLVAMTIMIDFVAQIGAVLEEPLIPVRNYQDIFKDLYDISYNDFGNRYGNPIPENENASDYNMNGTPESQVKPILLEYFERQNVSIPIEDEGNVYANGNKSAENNYTNEISNTIMNSVPVVIVTINNFYLNSSGHIDGYHKIAVSGSIEYNANYKVKPWYALWGVSREETFKAFVFSNGWEVSSADEAMNSVFIITDEARVSNIQYLDWTN